MVLRDIKVKSVFQKLREMKRLKVGEYKEFNWGEFGRALRVRRILIMRYHKSEGR